MYRDESESDLLPMLSWDNGNELRSTYVERKSTAALHLTTLSPL